MGQIQSNVGLVTGFAIQDTVDQLMALNAQPRNRLANRTAQIQQEQVAITELTALVVGVELTTDRLGQSSLFSATRVTSNKADLLSAVSSGTPKTGTYSFVPVRQAQSQQLTSSLFSSADQTFSQGEIVIHTGGFLDQSADLDQFNGGGGVSRGSIRITDRSGNSETIDLRFAETAQDVVDAINSNDELNVTAELDGDRFVLKDFSGSVTTDLQVDEVAGGTTAADLGLSLISTSDAEAAGTSVLNLTKNTSLRSLRDGIGIDLVDNEKLNFQLSDASSVEVEIDLDPNTASVGQLLDQINNAADGKFKASIASDGKSLEITDLTTGDGELTISSTTGSLAEQLGINKNSATGELSSKRLVSGLGDVLLSSLNGGQGFEQLGEITITDRSGTAATIDLSGAETLDDVIDALNDSGLGISAQLNRTKTGIEIVDTTSGSANDLTIEDADDSNTATQLGIAGISGSGSVDSGSLGLQSVSRNTRIDQFGGSGPIGGTIDITDTNGKKTSLNLTSLEPETIGDVIDAINDRDIGVRARINDTGDGIVLIDTAGGSESLLIEDKGSGTAAQRLGIAGTGKSQIVDGEAVVAVDGSTTIRLETDSETTLADLVDKINEKAGSPVNASLLSLGNGGGVRLLLNGKTTGSQGRVAIGSDIGLSFTETAKAQDALIAFGASDSSGGILVSSATNTFSGVIEDVELTINGTSDSATTVAIVENSENLTKQLETFVNQYNTMREKLSSLTIFDEATNSVGVLFASSIALRVDTSYSNFLSGTIRGAGNISSLGELGLSLNENGRMAFDKTKFTQTVQKDPAAVEEFFTREDTGFSARAKQISERLAGIENGALLTKNNSLQRQIEQNNQRLESFDLRLDRQRTRLLTQFFNMETAIGKLQSNLTALNSIQFIGPSNN